MVLAALASLGFVAAAVAWQRVERFEREDTRRCGSFRRGVVEVVDRPLPKTDTLVSG